MIQNWIGASGAQSWANTANWDTGIVPGTGDTVNIINLVSDIQTGLTQWIQFAALNIIGGTGTIGNAPGANDALQILPPTGTTIINTGSGRIVIDFGTGTYIVTITGSPTGGTFTITVNGQTTAGIAFNAAASVVQTAVALLSTVGAGNVLVTGSAGGPYTLTFANKLGYSLTFTSSGAGLTGGTSPAATPSTTAAVNHTTIVQATGSSPVDVGSQSCRIRGGGTGSKLYMSNSASLVGVATSTGGLVANLSEFYVDDGTLVTGSGLTWTTATQDAGNVTVNSGGTTFTQNGAQSVLTANGTGPITTVSISGRGTLNNRPAAGTDIFATCNVGPNATLDLSADPRPGQITNPINAAKGAKISAFSPGQITMHGGSPGLQIRTGQGVGMKDITVDIGGPVLATLVAG